MSVSTSFQHLNRQIAPEAHTPMYNFHKYWSRKTWNVVGKFIENYCPEKGIVFDPFGGSGITAMESLKRGRKVIISDLNPIACEITRLTIKPVNLLKLHQSFELIEQKVKHKILDLYKTKCRKCGKEIIFDCAIRLQDVIQEIRYKACPYCGDERRTKSVPLIFDIDLIKRIDAHKISEWYPSNSFYYNNGSPFKEKQRYDGVSDLFTKRNLYALAILMDAIEQEENKEIKQFLKIAFSSMVHLCTKMSPISEGGHFTPFSSAWTQHSYWFPSGLYMEQNVWNKFESSINGAQGLKVAKEESNRYFKDVKFGKKFEDVLEGRADVFIYRGDCIELMDKMHKKYEAGCVDYVFTDPPYGSSIQYGELSYLWNAWLKLDDDYLTNIDGKEIIINERQNKDFIVYTSLLQNSFKGIFKILKPNKYLTLTFHNPTFKIRNATINTGILSGFELQKIHHQELARPSAKSLLQPFGSAQGDFYLRFYKPNTGKEGLKHELIDEIRFEKIVVDTTIRILAERGEPTPYTIIINAIDPELAKQGFFSELETGLDSEKVLRDHLNKEFCLVEGSIGSNTGKLWWFVNPNFVAHLEKIPLTERVEQTVLRQLQSKGRVTFTDIWEAVSIAFPNSLTSDQSSIKSSLEDYARPVHGGYWMIKQNFQPGVVEKEHTTIIALIAETGIKHGYNIHIGKVEQSHRINTPLVKKEVLSDYISFRNLSHLNNMSNAEIVEDIDIIWTRGGNIEYIFEVECTTSMTSALQRGSVTDSNIPKYMLFPSDRLKQFERKMNTPMFSERFASDNWRFIIFDQFYKAWNRRKGELDLEEIANLGLNEKNKVDKNKDQLKIEF